MFASDIDWLCMCTANAEVDFAYMISLNNHYANKRFIH